jgi:hypothetical protein
MADAPLIITRSDGESWSFDAVTRQASDPRARITDHPVESGSSISDHSIREPIRETASATVTRSPLEGRTYDQPTGQEREAAATEFLAGCWGLLLTISYPDEDLDSYLLTSMANERGPYGAKRFALEFREVVIVESQTVEIPVTQAAPAAADGLASEVDAGEQSGESTETSDTTDSDGVIPPEEEAASSWLDQILYGDEQEEDAA